MMDLLLKTVPNLELHIKDSSFYYEYTHFFFSFITFSFNLNLEALFRLK